MTPRFRPGGPDRRGALWRCTGWHDREGEIVWSQWFTYDKINMPCPEHGTEFLVKG